MTTAEATALGARHQRVQRLRRLFRRSNVRLQERAFVVEGIKVVGAALEAGAPLESVYLAHEGRGEAAVEELAATAFARGARLFELGPGLMEKVADTVSPQPICAVAAMCDRGLAETLALVADRSGPAKSLVVCADVRDPGNLGAVVRSAAAGGVSAVVCCDGCADVFNPKAVRASAGAVFHVPIARGVAPVAALVSVGAAGYRRVGTSAHGGESYLGPALDGEVAILLGNEAAGLPPALEQLTDALVTVPMAGPAESLNVAMTATVLAFEMARRRAAPPDASGQLP